MGGSSLRRQVLLSSTMLVAALTGYGRRAYGQVVCLPAGGSTYECSGASSTTQAILNITNAEVVTLDAPDFSVDTSAGVGGNAITITGQGNLSYFDEFGSELTAGASAGNVDTALYILAPGDDGAIPGSVTITTNGDLEGERGIYAFANGTGFVSVTATGDVTGTTNTGIFARNGGPGNSTGTYLSVTAGTSTTGVSGTIGISAQNYGAGILEITANGDVTGTTGDAIFATNANGTDLNVTTAADTMVMGAQSGIFAINDAPDGGALTIEAYGNVTGTANNGIYARNDGTDLMVSTGAGTMVTGGNRGIFAVNNGIGALNITANGDVTSDAGVGIFADSNGNGLDLTVGANSTVHGYFNAIRAENAAGLLKFDINGEVDSDLGYGISANNEAGSGALTITTMAGSKINSALHGIAADNFGMGALNVTANGEVTSSDQDGIHAENGDAFTTAGTNLTVRTGAASTIAGLETGIYAYNHGSGSLRITANGNATGTNFSGIYARNDDDADALRVTTGANSIVRGGEYGIGATNFGSGALTIVANGIVTGTGPGSIGIAADNINGNGLSITTGAKSRVTGHDCGILAENNIGALNIKAGGDVIGTNCAGIEAMNGGTKSTITTGKDSVVRGRYYGIDLLHFGTGAVNIEVNGDVVAPNGTGIMAAHLASGGTINITVGPDGHVTSGGNDPLFDFGIVSVGGQSDIVVAGKVDSGAAGAILFDQCDCFDNRLELQPGFEINGKVFAGPGPNDALVLGGKGNGAFNLNRIDTGGGTKQYQNFENFEVVSGDWTFSGATTQAFTVNGGTVMGNGTFGGLTFTGGVLAPGNSFGTITVNGPFSLGSGAIYEVEVNANGKSDRVVVRGTVSLTGSVLRVLAANGNYNPQTDYVIIDNDGNDRVKGRFATTTTNLAFLTPSVDYRGGDGNDVVLTLVRTIGPDGPVSFCDVALTRNQCNVGLALDQFPTTNALFLAVLNQTAEGARTAFDALSGEIHATLSGVLADDSRYVREAILGRLMQANATDGGDIQVASLAAAGPQVASLDANAMTLGSGRSLDMPAPYGQPLAFWTRAYGAWGDFNGDRNAATADRDLGGFVSGMDAQLSGSWRAGLATGASFSNIDVNDRYSSADVESFLLAGYLGGMAGPLALRGGGAWAWNDIDTSRAVIFPGIFERQKASYDADTGQIFGEVAYPMAMGGLALEPFAGLAYVSIDGENFREHGGALASLRGGADQDVGYSTLGLRAATTMHWGSTLVVPHVSVAWQHAFDDVTPGAALAFATTGIGFAIDGVPLAEDSALIDAGLDFALGPNTTAGVSYSGQFGDGVTDNAVKGRFTWLF